MAVIVMDDLWLCDDCTIAAVNDDYTGLDYHYGPDEAADRVAAIHEGFERLGYLAPMDNELEFSRMPCDCCRTTLAGRRTEFVVLAAREEGQDQCGGCGEIIQEGENHRDCADIGGDL